MNQKRVSIFLLSFIALSVLTITVVAAAPETSDIVTGVKNFFTPILAAIFGESTQIFEQLLFALLIVAFVYMALERVPIISENAFALWTATIATAILAVRFIVTENLIDFLLTPQGVLGISLLTIIPFVIYFWFVEFGLAGAGSRVLRKLAWVVYGVVFAVLWWKNYYNVDIDKNWNHLYLVVAIVALALMFWDRTIQGAIAKSKSASHLDEIQERQVAIIKKKMSDAQRDLEGEDLVKELKKLDKALKEALKIRR